MKILATIVLAGALAACSNGPNCEVCPALGNTCVPPGACTPASCQRPIVSSALPSNQVQYLGTHKVGTELPFTVPPDAGSVTIVQQAKIASLTIVYKNQALDNSAVPLTITFPDGGVAYDDNNPAVAAIVNNGSPDGGADLSGFYAAYGGDTPNTAAFTFPNTTTSLAAGVPEGAWKFVVNDYANECTFISGCSDGGSADSVYDVSVVTRTQPQGSTLDVAFYIVADMTTPSGAPLRAANATTDQSVQRMVQSFKGILAQAGITANVTFYDVAASDRTRFGTNLSVTLTGPCEEMNQMLTLSGAHSANSMNLFLVQGLQSSDSTGTLYVVGIDGTIPGPSSFNGTVQSGAVVSIADLFSGMAQCAGGLNVSSCGADAAAYIAAHEAGHFLGLFHTTEQAGADFDPLADTDKCPCLTCSSTRDRPNCGTSTPRLFANYCLSPPSCGGGDNLMFWLLAPGAKLSPQQAQVMRLNPLVH